MNVFKFPHGGYEVNVCKKQDILDCIDDNIIDKEVALALVQQCEKEAAKYISEGRWAGVPFIGNIRVPRNKQLEKEKDQQELIEAAKENLDPKAYILFRRNLMIDNSKRAKFEKLSNYIISMMITKNKKTYKKLCSKHSKYYANIYMYTMHKVYTIETESLELLEYEQQTTNR